MITLRKMKFEEFSAYKEYFIEDYGKEIAANYDHSVEKGIQLAQQELEEDLPLNVVTIDHYLFCIELNSDSDTKLIGYLWDILMKKRALNYEQQLFRF